MGATGRELVRLAQERVIAIERAIDSRKWRSDDPLLRQLEKDLHEAQARFAYKTKMEHDR